MFLVSEEEEGGKWTGKRETRLGSVLQKKKGEKTECGDYEVVSQRGTLDT
jgi:hypothetical protein